METMSKWGLSEGFKETNWNLFLGDVEKMWNFSKATVYTVKKAIIPLYRQRRLIKLEGRIIKLSLKWMALEAQIQKQFIQTIDKQLKEEEIET